MKKIELKTIIFEYENIGELDIKLQELIKKAQDATLNAYAPYSKFNVGAAVLLENDEIICGNNQENAAYPSGLCAERVALFYANAQYPNQPVKAIAVSVFKDGDFISTPIPPCGACRQVILETETRFKKPIKIILTSKSKIQIIENAKTLLPISFSDNFL